MSRILIAEDEPRIAAFLEKGLRASGFTTAIANSGQDVLDQAGGQNFDLLILDLGLPDRDGFQILKELRGQGETLPIIILTARDDLSDKVAGLEAGADDYVTKPFRFAELLARVRARLRNQTGKPADDNKTLSTANVCLNLYTREVQVADRTVQLSAKEFLLLETFLRHPEQVLSREQLLDQVWGYDYDPGSNIVDVYVGYLRKKLGSDRIETVRGMGYRLSTSPASSPHI
ncbi:MULTISPECIES: response regulator transcription factor [Arthrospira]|jgi:DNA-binding response OmpR family regulator|uniref:Two-component response regulator n=1 Tax=Limnospira platensis NIES-46 TaxID=1236695 RepID=A0A5M3T3Q5_LIMPL|nr:response regulator transcription factor [Arthrospira platensis]AMW27311.1 two-component system response regulator [Arthrospira platensis YZ]KDR57744.1 transcriptional regulator [Arthrospira platensis str. Paraca]MBD2668540.1 response regulator transcription factor [Arthrospira platensis FACHB-439]MBD2710220.1 response regulator transcription factor [Arthrospira platensis FACHB-835]MDF2211147.1 response regulator transcription factor [Arthrospira platensis NCB002]MDT9181678.1 response regul